MLKQMRFYVVTMLLLSASAHAHFSLVNPASALQTDDGGKGGPPCGLGLDSNVVTEVLGGHPVPLRIQEFVFHPGHYRVALSVNSRSELPPDPAVQQSNGSSVSTLIQNPAKAPILADGLFAHVDPPTGDWTSEVILPNLNCEKCTLQVSEFMAQHGAPYFYHHCANLKIKVDPGLPLADAAWPKSTSAAIRQMTAVMPHIADGGGWQTAFTLVNLDTVPAPFTLRFWGDDGASLPLSFTGLGKLATFSGVLKVGGSQTMQTEGSPPFPVTGWAQISSPQAVDGQAIFRFQASGQEAAVPLLQGGSRRLVLPFESGAGLATGIAIANISETEDTIITLTVRNEQGDVISTQPELALLRMQHSSFTLAVPANRIAQRGTLELKSTNADVVVLGIRSNNGAITTVRALAMPSTKE